MKGTHVHGNTREVRGMYGMVGNRHSRSTNTYFGDDVMMRTDTMEALMKIVVSSLVEDSWRRDVLELDEGQPRHVPQYLYPYSDGMNFLLTYLWTGNLKHETAHFL